MLDSNEYDETSVIRRDKIILYSSLAGLVGLWRKEGGGWSDCLNEVKKNKKINFKKTK